MNRYLLSFYKKGNIRFISHLDLQKLFQRAFRRGGVDVAYSNGFNPHELMNIVSPLSLGYEGEEELVEVDTEHEYEGEDLIRRMNLAMPEGLKFFACEELVRNNKSTSCPIGSVIYKLTYDCEEELTLKTEEFLNQDAIMILKRDKKTKKMVERDVKAQIISITQLKDERNTLLLELSTVFNATPNPGNITASLFAFSGLEFKPELARVTRLKLCRI